MRQFSLMKQCRWYSLPEDYYGESAYATYLTDGIAGYDVVADTAAAPGTRCELF